MGDAAEIDDPATERYNRLASLADFHADLRQAQINALDKAVLALSAGGLGVLVAVAGRQPAALHGAGALIFALAAASMAFAAIMTLATFALSARACSEEIESIHEVMRADCQGDVRPNRVAPLSRWAHRAGLLAIALGVALSSTFVIVSSQGGGEDDGGGTRHGEIKSEPPPPPRQADPPPPPKKDR